MDIHKMTVEEFAKESEDNKLMQSFIWTKAYELEARVKQLDGLITKWKARAVEADRNPYGHGGHYEECADDLEAALNQEEE